MNFKFKFSFGLIDEKIVQYILKINNRNVFNIVTDDFVGLSNYII